MQVLSSAPSTATATAFSREMPRDASLRSSASQVLHTQSRGDGSPELGEGRLLASHALLLHLNK